MNIQRTVVLRIGDPAGRVLGSDTGDNVARGAGVRTGAWAGRVIGGISGAIGALLAGGGLWLLVLGGSTYYVLAGIGYVVAGALLWRRQAEGAWLMLALLGITIFWALCEAGLDYWALFPRVFVPAGLAQLALVAALRFPTNGSRRAMAIAASVVAIALTAEFGRAFFPNSVVRNALARPFVAAPTSEQPSDWTSYGRTNAGTRYAPLTGHQYGSSPDCGHEPIQTKSRPFTDDFAPSPHHTAV